MQVLVLSDLHVECSPFTPDASATSAVDVVVLAGDIHKGIRSVEWARGTFPDKPIVLVAGNHEFYDGEWERTLVAMRESALCHEVHLLENDTVTINGVQFLGSTLWTDFAYFGERSVKEAMAEARKHMMDYQSIKGCTPERTVERHAASRAWLEQELSKPLTARGRVVVTHHYPHKNSTSAEYRNDLCTAAFGSNLPTELLNKADLWIHGHTHSSHDYLVGQCRVVCNPRGYPKRRVGDDYENPAFDAALLM